MKVRDAALKLEVCKDTLYRWIKAGKIPAVRWGRSIRLRTCDVRDFTRPE